MLLRAVFILLACLFLFATLRLLVFLLSFSSRGTGITPEGKLLPCPSTPNCVCSEYVGIDSSRIDPIKPKSSPEEFWAEARSNVSGMGGKVREVSENYLWATFKTPILGFVDDLELRFDSENNLVHVRSASRVGYSDLGVNRKRVEELRTRLAR